MTLTLRQSSRNKSKTDRNSDADHPPRHQTVVKIPDTVAKYRKAWQDPAFPTGIFDASDILEASGVPRGVACGLACDSGAQLPTNCDDDVVVLASALGKAFQTELAQAINLCPKLQIVMIRCATRCGPGGGVYGEHWFPASLVDRRTREAGPRASSASSSAAAAPPTSTASSASASSSAPAAPPTSTGPSTAAGTAAADAAAAEEASSSSDDDWINADNESDLKTEAAAINPDDESDLKTEATAVANAAAAERPADKQTPSWSRQFLWVEGAHQSALPHPPISSAASSGLVDHPDPDPDVSDSKDQGAEASASDSKDQGAEASAGKREMGQCKRQKVIVLPFLSRPGHTVTAVKDGDETQYVVRRGHSSVTFFRRTVTTEAWLNYRDFTSVFISGSGVEVLKPRGGYPKPEDSLHQTGVGQLGPGEHTAEVLLALPHDCAELRKHTSDAVVIAVLREQLDGAAADVSGVQASKENPDVLLVRYRVSSFSKVGFISASALAAAARAAMHVAAPPNPPPQTKKKKKKQAKSSQKKRAKSSQHAWGPRYGAAASGNGKAVVSPAKLRNMPIGKPPLVDTAPQDWTTSPCWAGRPIPHDGSAPSATTPRSCAADALSVAAGKPDALAPPLLLAAGLTDRSRSVDPAASATDRLAEDDTGGVDLFGRQVQSVLMVAGFALRQVRIAPASADLPADASADRSDASANPPADTSADLDCTATTPANYTAAAGPNPGAKPKGPKRKARMRGGKHVGGSRRSGARNRAGSVPTMMQLLRQPGGVYLVEFRWENRKTAEASTKEETLSDWHIVAVNCSHRYIYCNTMGYIPFSCCNGDGDLRARGESVATHENVTGLLGDVHDIARVWQLCRLDHLNPPCPTTRPPVPGGPSVVTPDLP